MLYWIYDYPTASVGALFGFAFVAVTWLGILLLRPIVQTRLHGDRPANEVVGFTLASFSVLYGILLGLLAVEAYQNFATADDIVSKEASSLAALYRDTGGYPQPIRAELQHELREYAREVIEVSWPKQRQGVEPTGESERVAAFFQKLLSFEPTEKRDEIIFSETLRQFNEFLERRRTRLDSITTGIPAILWWVVAIGAAVHIILIWMLDMEAHVHVLLGGVLSFFFGEVIFLIAAMDNPFRGQVSSGPEAIQLVFDSMMRPR